MSSRAARQALLGDDDDMARGGGGFDTELGQMWAEDDDGQMSFVEAMEEHMPSYDEGLYYACKEYMQIHSLYYKQLKRSQKPEEVPFRYKALMLWTRPLATVAGQVYFSFQCLLVLASITQLVLETIPQYSAEVYPHMQQYWDAVEIPTASFFFIDIVVHMLLLPPIPNDFSRYSRKTYVRKLEFWVDVVTILPTVLAYFALIIPSLPQVDFLKSLRILRFTKVLRQFHAVDQLAFTIERSWKPLLGPFVFLFGTLLLMSGVLFYLERGDYNPDTMVYEIDDYDCLMSAPRILNPAYPCPKKRSPFLSLPHTLWFALVTITTVGYGDMVPSTHLGRAAAAITILCGNVLTAMPIAIVGTYFTDIVTSNRLRQAGDAASAFGRRGGASQAAANRPARTGSRGADDLTIGERLLEILSADDADIDLADPTGAAVHQINNFMRTEFNSFTGQLYRTGVVRKIQQQRETALTPLRLVMDTGGMGASGRSAAAPTTYELQRALPFVIGNLPGSLRVALQGMYPTCLPAILFVAYQSQVPPHAVTIKPLFPAVVQVNANAIPYDTPTRLLVGDTVSVHQHTRAPPLFMYIYAKTESESTSTGLPGGGGDRERARIEELHQQHKARRGAVQETDVSSALLLADAAVAGPGAAGGAGSSGGAAAGGLRPGSDGTITLRSVGVPQEHRGLTFAAYNRQTTMFDDL